MKLLREINERARFMEASEEASKGLEKYVSAKNWPKELDAAKDFGKEAVSHFKFKEKIPKFNAAIDSAPTVAKVQSIVINAILSGEGKGVLK